MASTCFKRAPWSQERRIWEILPSLLKLTKWSWECQRIGPVSRAMRGSARRTHNWEVDNAITDEVVVQLGQIDHSKVGTAAGQEFQPGVNLECGVNLPIYCTQDVLLLLAHLLRHGADVLDDLSGAFDGCSGWDVVQRGIVSQQGSAGRCQELRVNGSHSERRRLFG